MKPTPITSLPPEYALRVLVRISRHTRQMPNQCIEWVGARDQDGYGRFIIKVGGKTRQTGAHRAAWLARSPISDPELVIDHLCRNRLCVNLDHLELVTNAENIRRGEAGKNATGAPRLGPHGQHACGKHGRVDGYEKTRANGYSHWVCRECHRAYKKRYYAAKKELAA